MRWKTTLVLLIATVALGAYVSLVELKHPTPEQQQRLDTQVARILPDDAKELTITSSSGTVTLARADGHWRMRAPKSARADEDLVRRILNQLSPLDAARVLRGSKDKPLKLAEFGMEPPKATLAVTTSAAAVSLAFGEPTAVGHQHYVRRGNDSTVYVVPDGLLDLLTQPVDAFRSHQLVSLEAWKLTGLEVASNRASYSLTHGTADTDRWRLAKPIEDLADPDATSQVVSALTKLPIERVITDEPKADALPTYGFDQPYAKVTADVEEGPKLEVVFGSATNDDAQQVYAKRSDEPSIYAVSRSKVDDLLPEPSALRARACFATDPTQATKLEIQWPNNAWTIELKDHQWKAAGGGEALDQERVDALLARVKDIKVAQFVPNETASAQNGLAPAQGIVRVWTTDSESAQQLEIGNLKDQTTGRYGRIERRPGLVELPPEILGIMQTPLASLKPAPASTPPPAKTPVH